MPASNLDDGLCEFQDKVLARLNTINPPGWDSLSLWERQRVVSSSYFANNEAFAGDYSDRNVSISVLIAQSMSYLILEISKHRESKESHR